ncbi:MAG: hypothetical protein D6B25_07425 [Desulfobulbaceae bacterium]|nr:MAG: hypothetical protein D6B25_07425 [Desulfobulbaceae bacterium]
MKFAFRVPLRVLMLPTHVVTRFNLVLIIFKSKRDRTITKYFEPLTLELVHKDESRMSLRVIKNESMRKQKSSYKIIN